MHPQAMKSYQAGSRFPLPGARGAARWPRSSTRSSAGSTAPRRAPCAPTCARCPATSTASTAGCAEGVLGGETVNAADLQIAPTSRLMLTIGDVRPYFAGRPAEAHAMGLFAEWAGRDAGRGVPGGVAVSRAHSRLSGASRLRPPAARRPRARSRG